MTKQDEFLTRVAKKGPVPAPAVETVWPDFKVDLDRVIVRPMEPERHLGGGIIAASRKTLEANIALTNIGQISDIGPCAWTAVTRDGVDYNKTIGYKIGDWVRYKSKSGDPMLIRKASADKVDALESPRQIILEDRDILGKFASEADARMVWMYAQ